MHNVVTGQSDDNKNDVYNSAMLNHAHEDLCAALTTKGYAIIEDTLPAAITNALREEALRLRAAGEMQRAHTGKNPRQNNLRGDFTHWLADENKNCAAVKKYLAHMQALREALNEQLFLGLNEYETHFALYPAGAGYSKHLDQFQPSQLNHAPNNQAQRKISVVLYLNTDWQTDDGGHLKLYLSETKTIEIAPIGGRMILFLSAQFWHEVLPAKRDRISLTGWFKTR